MADAPRGAQPGGTGHHRAHQLVGVQAALHQRLHLARAGHGHGLVGGFVAVLGVDDAHARQVGAGRLGHGMDLGLRPHQHRHDQPAPRRFQRTQQRIVVARVDHRGQHRRHVLAALEQAREHIGVAQHDLRRGHVGEADALRRRHHGDGAGDQVHVAVDHMAVEDDLVAVGALLLDGERACDLVAHAHAAAEAQVLRHDHCARPRQPALQQRRNQRLRGHAFGRHGVLARALRVGVEGVHVAGDEGQRLHVRARQLVRAGDALADLDFVEGAVGEGVHRGPRVLGWARC
jgi:hypothetical protein